MIVGGHTVIHSTNPEAENDLRSIRQPVVDFRERCQLPQERQP